MSASGRVHEIPNLPEGARSLTTLADSAGYTDTFLAEVPPEQRSAEAWSRMILEHAPAALRASLPPGWAALGLRHGPLHSSDHVLGWPIRERAEDHILLGADSRLGMAAELLIARWEGSLLFATVIRFDAAPMRVLWTGIERPHRRIVRTLLEHASAQSRSTSVRA